MDDSIDVYAVFETAGAHKALVCLFRTEKAAKGYAADMNEYEAGLKHPSTAFTYKVERWTVSGC